MFLGAFDLTYSILTGVVSVLLAGVASAIIFELSRDKETALRTFHLNQDESLMDFQVFFFANLVMLVTFLIYLFGVLADLALLKGLNNYMLSLYGVFLVSLFARWWKRF